MWIRKHVCGLACVFVCVCICFSVCIRLCLYRKKAAKRCLLMCRVVLSILRFMFFSGLLAFVARVSQFVSVIPRFIYMYICTRNRVLSKREKKVHKIEENEQKKLQPKINRPTKSVVLVNVHIFIRALFWGISLKMLVIFVGLFLKVQIPMKFTQKTILCNVPHWTKIKGKHTERNIKTREEKKNERYNTRKY